MKAEDESMKNLPKAFKDITNLQKLKTGTRECGKSMTEQLPETKLSEPEKRISELFLKLSILYDWKFTGKFPGEKERVAAMQVWEKFLKNLTDEQIDHGFLKCKDFRDDDGYVRAPNVVEFMELCPPVKKPSSFGITKQQAILTEHELKERQERIYKQNPELANILRRGRELREQEERHRQSGVTALTRIREA